MSGATQDLQVCLRWLHEVGQRAASSIAYVGHWLGWSVGALKADHKVKCALLLLCLSASAELRPGQHHEVLVCQCRRGRQGCM